MNTSNKVVFITGAAKRIGAGLAKSLHASGMNVMIHYHTSAPEAMALKAELNAYRSDSADIIQADLLRISAFPQLIQQVAACWGRLDAVIHNASTYFPTAFDNFSEADWDSLVGTNLKIPAFLTQAAVPVLAQHGGRIVMIIGKQGVDPIPAYSLYSIAEAGAAMLTRAFSASLPPNVTLHSVISGPALPPDAVLLTPAAEALIDKITRMITPPTLNTVR